MKVISGNWQDASGTPVSNGRLFLRLSQDATAISTGQIAPSLVSIPLDINGNIPANTKIWANDELSPTGTTYTASVLAQGGGLVWGAESLSITGASPINLNTLVPTTASVMLANPVLQNPTGPQTITGFPLTINSNLTVGGTLNVTGISTFGAIIGASLGNIQIANAGTAGADWCAKVTTLDTALGANSGEIWVDQSANTGGACASAPTLSPLHTLRFTQGGVYAISVGWSQNNVGNWGIVGSPGSLTFISFTGSAGFIADGSAFGNDEQNITIKDIVFSGNAGIANAAQFINVARATFENMQGINATTNGLWFRGLLISTFKRTGSSVNMMSGSAIPYTTIPTNGINIDANPSATAASIGNTGDIFGEGIAGASKTCVALTDIVGSPGLIVTTAEGCGTGVSIGGAGFGNTLFIGDLESNTVADVVIAGFRNRVTFRSASTIAGAINVTGNDNWLSGETQNLTIGVGVQGTHLENVDYSVATAGGTITDSSSPTSTTKIKVRNSNTGVYDADVLGGTRILLLSGTDAITSNPPFGTLNNGWKIGLNGYGIGNGANTLAFGFGGNSWISFCNGGLANGATGSVPDANCGINLTGAGSMWLRQSAAPTGSANIGQYWYDNGINRFRMNNNNTGAVTLGTTPLYNAAGTEQLGTPHAVQDTCTLGTNCAVTLAGNAVFTSATSYTCVCEDETAIASCKVAQTSGSAFTITGTGTDVIRYMCIGN